ncbi:hypothetical protein RVBP21_3580 [Pseudomonas phage BRkr]|nr:hypothetical protein RVBP21_3580 [Pseudomonas phage BRkr]
MSQFKERMYSARRNPALMQTIALNELDTQMNGSSNGAVIADIPDASIPFVFSLEIGSMETAMAIGEMEALGRQLYPRLSLGSEELYKHMSDDDYIGRFASPARTTFNFLIAYDEVIAKAVAVGDTGIKKLVIPRLTEFDAAGIKFTMQYPIEIRVMRHGGITIEYVLDKKSPVETLSTNIVPWSMLVIDRRKVISLSIPVYQFAVKTHTESLNPSSLFQESYTFTDQFFYARAYISRTEDDNWVELKTTHSALVYDPMELTVVFKVIGNKLQVSIPTIYTNTRMAQGDIRIDIYTTQGKMDRDLGAYKANQFKFYLNSIDDDSSYVSPLTTFNLIQSLARGRVEGGANSVDFNVLRNQVINNTLGANQVPITNVQITDAVNRRGYTLVSNIDNITNRQFLASRRLGAPRSLDVISGAGVAMSQLKVDMESLAGSIHVADNGDRLTIKPSMLYTFNNGRVNTVADAEIARLKGSTAEQIAREMNNGRYVYSPFHNVLDASRENFEVRPYYLDNPTITEKIFVGENDTANLQAAIDVFDIVKTDEGYRITVRLESGEQFKKLADEQVVLQIGYQPAGEVRWASVNGKFIGIEDGERVFTFDIKTNHDINSKNELYTTNMSMFSEVQNNFASTLNNMFDITILVVNTSTPGYQPNQIDEMVQAHLLPQQFMVVNRERLVTTLGYDMTKMWRRSRTVLGDESYQHWEHDVMWFYEENEYKRDEAGNIIVTIKPDGTLDYEILHRKGDPVLDAQGNQVRKHQKGDVMLDSNGKPILVAPRKRLREITLMMVDGLFYFANEKSALDYKVEIPMEFVTWLENDISILDAQLLEMCEMYLYPTTTYGDTTVTVREGQKATISVDQAFTLSFYLKPAEYTNTTIRPSLMANGKSVLNEYISRKTVSMSDTVAQLEATSGDGVQALEVFGLGGTNNYAILTVEDDAVRLAIRKKLVVLANQELTVEDDVQFNFLKHEVLNN